MMKQPYDFSLITIVNKDDVYQEFKASLAQQKDIDYELIRINNEHQQYQSARQAFNEAAQKAKGEYLVFLHPDIRFLDPHALKDVLMQIKGLPNLGVAGIAGSPTELKNGDRVILTTIVQGDNQSSVGEKINAPTSVQTLDECFFVMTKAFWQAHPFTDCPGWHFYAVEQSLVALLAGKQNYVVPAHIWHTSAGASEDYHYVQIARQMIKQYGADFPTINTTVRKWETRGWQAQVKSLLYLGKRYITTYLRK
ncbi:glycosyltransferase [Limosilactobacillus ingluviei]